MTSLTYPDSLWYTVNNVYYWPYRGWDATGDPSYPMGRGDYRYFRYNVAAGKPWSFDPNKRAATACIRLRGMSCYEVADGNSYFCEGFLEPECDGVTLNNLINVLYPTAIEVATESIWGVEEAISNLDDFLNFGYPEINPVTLAGPDDHLIADSYYPIAAFYKGKSQNTLYRSPTPAEAQSLLAVKGMGFYQPYPTMDPTAISFVLYTANQTPTPRELQKILLADYVAVNLNPLDSDEQRALQEYDAGANSLDSVTRLFTATGQGVSGTLGLASTILENLKYIALVGLGVATVYAGAQIYGAARNREGK